MPQAEGFARINVAALWLWVNPFGSQARHFPYIALTRDTGGDIAGSGLWLSCTLLRVSQSVGLSTINPQPLTEQSDIIPFDDCHHDNSFI